MRVFKTLTRALVAAALTTPAFGAAPQERHWNTIATYRGTVPGLIHVPDNGLRPSFVYGGPKQRPVQRLVMEFDQDGQLRTIQDNSPNPIILDARIHHEILVR